MRTCNKCPCDEFADESKFFCAILGMKVYWAQAKNCRVDDAWRILLTTGKAPEDKHAPVLPPDLIPAAERLAEETGDSTILEKAGHLTVAIARWSRSGFKCRTDEEVAQIYRAHCGPCDARDQEVDACRLCGCNVRSEGIAVRNKLKMATEKCPRGKW